MLVTLGTPAYFSRRNRSYNFRMSCRITLQRKGRRRTAYLTRSIVLFIKSTPLTLFLHPTGRNFPTNKPIKLIKLSANLYDDPDVVTGGVGILKDIANGLCTEQGFYTLGRYISYVHSIDIWNLVYRNTLDIYSYISMPCQVYLWGFIIHYDFVQQNRHFEK